MITFFKFKNILFFLGGCKALQAVGAKEINVEDLGDAEAAAEGSILGTWKFQEFKTKKDEPPKITFYTCDESWQEDWKKGVIKADAQNLARLLMETPANHMTPTIFADTVKTKLENLDVKVDVHERDWIEKQGMFSFLSVSLIFYLKNKLFQVS